MVKRLVKRGDLDKLRLPRRLLETSLLAMTEQDY
jgi:hypothetical protein